MFPFKVCFLDIDGTLQGSDGRIGPRTQSELERLRSSGIILALATGRPFFGCRTVIEKLGINGVSLFFSGALLADPAGKVFSKSCISAGQVQQLISYCKFEKYNLELYDAQHFYVEMVDEFTQIHIDSYLKVDPIRTQLSNIKGPVLKAGLIFESSLASSIASRIREKFSDLSVVVSSGASHPNMKFINITSQQADRSLALDLLCRHYNVSTDQVLAFGDSESDLPFITGVKFGVAMGNSSRDVRSQAKFVAPSVDADGIGEFLKANWPTSKLL